MQNAKTTSDELMARLERQLERLPEFRREQGLSLRSRGRNDFVDVVLCGFCGICHCHSPLFGLPASPATLDRIARGLAIIQKD